jgi:hypothetical protein
MKNTEATHPNITSADVAEPMFVREMQSHGTIHPTVVATGRGGSRKHQLHYAWCPNVAKTDRWYVRPVWPAPMSDGGHRIYSAAKCCFGGRTFHPALG